MLSNYCLDEENICTLFRPTVSLGVTSAVVSSCGHDSGQIEQRVAHELAGHWATHEGPAERPPHRHPPHAQPLAPVRQPQGRRPRLTPRGCTDQTPPSDEGQPCGRLREEQRHHRSLVPREAMPGRRSSFRLLHHHTLFFCSMVTWNGTGIGISSLKRCSKSRRPHWKRLQSQRFLR
jgi:hypothetical protein